MTLELPDELPLTILGALPGRTIGELVGHPLFADRPWVIRSVEETACGHLKVVFCTGVVRASLPWAGLLRDATAEAADAEPARCVRASD